MNITHFASTRVAAIGEATIGLDGNSRLDGANRRERDIEAED